MSDDTWQRDDEGTWWEDKPHLASLGVRFEQETAEVVVLVERDVDSYLVYCEEHRIPLRVFAEMTAFVDLLRRLDDEGA